MVNIILCAGKQTRFNSTIPKQLLPINGKPILQRTIEQLNYNATVITRDNAIVNFCKRNHINWYYPANNDKCVNTLLSTQELWNNRVNVWLGDVYYNQTCLDITLNCTQNLCTVGNGVEIFSISFVPHTKIIESLKVATQHPLGKLWQFYRVYSNIPLDSHKRDALGLYFIPNDCTDDIDTEEDYQKLKRKIEWT